MELQDFQNQLKENKIEASYYLKYLEAKKIHKEIDQFQKKWWLSPAYLTLIVAFLSIVIPVGYKIFSDLYSKSSWAEEIRGLKTEINKKSNELESKSIEVDLLTVDKNNIQLELKYKKKEFADIKNLKDTMEGSLKRQTKNLIVLEEDGTRLDSQNKSLKSNNKTLIDSVQIMEDRANLAKNNESMALKREQLSKEAIQLNVEAYKNRLFCRKFKIIENETKQLSQSSLYITIGEIREKNIIYSYTRIDSLFIIDSSTNRRSKTFYKITEGMPIEIIINEKDTISLLFPIIKDYEDVDGGGKDAALLNICYNNWGDFKELDEFVK